MTEYTPSDDEVRTAWHQYATATDAEYARLREDDDHPTHEFDRFLARVRRDAVQQFIGACRGKLDEPGFLLPSNHWGDIEAAIRVAESYVKNYPETEDQT